jgi:hypothetical protein
VAFLNVLLSHAVLEVTREAESLLPDVNVVQWSDFWRVADGADRRSLHLDGRISRRAIKTYIDREAKAETLKVDDGVVRLTAGGRRLRDKWGAAIGEACAACEERWGSELRDALAPFVEQLEFELPHYIHPYGASDPTITGGGAAGREHGMDWKPVMRSTESDSTSGLSILALLSQALAAFAIEYESRDGPLVWGVNISQFDEPIPLAHVPGSLGIPSTTPKWVERFGLVKVRGDMAHPTKTGQALKSKYERLVPEVESSWRTRYGENIIDTLRSALENVDASLTTGHADHPVVLHRGGIGFVEVTGTSH